MKDKYKNYAPKKRLLAITVLVTFLFCAVIAKLISVMIIDGARLQARALEQWMRDVPLQAERGAILDRNGIPLAQTSTLYTVYVRPNSVADAEATARALTKCLSLNYDKVYAKVKKRGVSEVTIAKNVSKDAMLDLVASDVSGIYYGENNYRYYPYGDFMTQLLGFTGSDGNGQTGLESYYDKFLTGVNGQILTETDLVGRELSDGGTAYLPAVSGYTMHTTLDYYIQRLCEGAVRRAMTQNKAKAAYCVAINPMNGDVYAIAEAPSFDLNAVPRDNLEQLFSTSKSMVVSGVYEPGSTFKILTAAAALDSGVYTPDSRFYCGGSHVVDGKRIKCWKTKGHGSISYAEGVTGSCNVVFMQSALAVGANRFYDYLSQFGVFTRTGIDMQGEASGLYIPLESVKNVDLARIGFGQAIAMTPLELLCGASSAVNGGVTVRPHIYDYITDYRGVTVGAYAQASGKRVISEQTSQTLRTLLTSVVSDGSGKGAYIEGFDIMGKTGTAQKYEKGVIAQGKYYSSFLGACTTAGRELAVLLIVDEPQGAYYGSVVAAPLVGDIFEGVFSYWGLSPKPAGSVDESEYYDPIF